MDEEPSADDEDEDGGVGDWLQEHPQPDTQVQGSQQQKGSSTRCTADEEELQEGDGSAHHQQPCNQLVQRQLLEEERGDDGYQTHDAEQHTIDGVVQGQSVQMFICHLKIPTCKKILK